MCAALKNKYQNDGHQCDTIYGDNQHSSSHQRFPRTIFCLFKKTSSFRWLSYRSLDDGLSELFVNYERLIWNVHAT